MILFWINKPLLLLFQMIIFLLRFDLLNHFLCLWIEIQVCIIELASPKDEFNFPIAWGGVVYFWTMNRLTFKDFQNKSELTFELTASASLSWFKRNTHSSQNYKDAADMVLSTNALAAERWGQRFKNITPGIFNLAKWVPAFFFFFTLFYHYHRHDFDPKMIEF